MQDKARHKDYDKIENRSIGRETDRNMYSPVNACPVIKRYSVVCVSLVNLTLTLFLAFWVFCVWVLAPRFASCVARGWKVWCVLLSGGPTRAVLYAIDVRGS